MSAIENKLALAEKIIDEAYKSLRSQVNTLEALRDNIKSLQEGLETSGESNLAAQMTERTKAYLSEDAVRVEVLPTLLARMRRLAASGRNSKSFKANNHNHALVVQRILEKEGFRVRPGAFPATITISWPKE